VIIPTYNRERFLGLAIQSVLDQTYANFEIIIVDDGSTDNTAEILKQYAGDDRVRCFAQPNQGQSVARNHGLQWADGEFICFLDSDNLWEPDKLRQQVLLFADNPSVDIIYGNSLTIDENGTVLDARPVTRHSGIIYRQLLLDNFVSFNTAMFKRYCYEELGGPESSIRVADDYDLWLRYSVKFTFLHVPIIFARYRVMTDQISSDKNRRFDSNQHIIEKFFRQNPDLLSNDEQAATWMHFYCRRGRYKCTKGEYGAALGDAILAIRKKPLALNPWRLALKTALSSTGMLKDSSVK
jgi:glycosyltransferase involved in cell wall biosynthesis